MRAGILRHGSAVAIGVLTCLLSACGGPQARTAPAGTAGDGGAAPAASVEVKPVEHPFAKDAKEATSLIQNDLDTHMRDMWKCVDAKRARAKDPHLHVVVNIGIDQEGSLIGISAVKQADTDQALNDCLMTSLQRVPWPKSHAGIITVKQEFTDRPVYPE